MAQLVAPPRRRPRRACEDARVRLVVYGAGAIGGVIGGRCAQGGEDVVLVARGAHLEAIQRQGLVVESPDSSVTVPVRAVGHPSELDLGDGDVVVLAMKSQDTGEALEALREVAPSSTPIVCAQNGVENERVAARRFANTYGMRVILAGTHLEPGVVEIATAPVSGVLDVGRFPEGVDDVAERMAEDLRASGFDARATPKIMSHKYLKLVNNVSNAIQAACGLGDDPVADELDAAARAEARACYAAAGIELADESDEAERRRLRGPTRPVGGSTREGGSSWQSLQRQTGNIEADWLNGEIVLLGRLHGVPTPVNERLQAVANRMAFEHTPPGSMTGEELAAGLL